MATYRLMSRRGASTRQWGGSRNGGGGRRRSVAGFVTGWYQDHYGKGKRALDQAVAFIGRKRARDLVADDDPDPEAVSVLSPSAPRSVGRPPTRRAISVDGTDNVMIDRRHYSYLQLRATEASVLAVELRAAKQFIRRLEQQLEKVGKISDMPKSEKEQICSLIMAHGVSAESFPSVAYLFQRLFLGRVDPDMVPSPSTVLNYTRSTGTGQQMSVGQEVVESGLLSVQLDATRRSSGLLSVFAVGSKPNGAPRQLFLFQLICREKDASGIKDALLQGLEIHLRPFLGQEDPLVIDCIGSDGANVMIGQEAGLGRLVEQEQRSIVLQDSCEKHFYALLLSYPFSKVFRRAMMNVPSLNQFLYLTWYLENEAWDLILVHASRVIMDCITDSGDVRPDLIDFFAAFEGDNITERAATALSELGKAKKPAYFRWETVGDLIEYVIRWRDVLRLAFDWLGVHTGPATAGSVAAMADQWIEWNASVQLRAQLAFAAEYVEQVWRPYTLLVNNKETCYYSDKSMFAAVFRPKRALELLMQVELLEKCPDKFLSWTGLLNAYDQANEARNMATTLFSAAVSCIERNASCYYRDLHALGGAGDPDFAIVLWEALSHKFDHRFKPERRSTLGKRLEKELDLAHITGYRKDMYDKLTSCDGLDELWKLVSPLLNPSVDETTKKEAYVRTLTENNETPWTAFLWACRRRVTHTQLVERSFQQTDFINARHHGGTKTKGTNARGSVLGQVTRSSLLALRQQISSCRQAVADDLDISAPRSKAALAAVVERLLDQQLDEDALAIGQEVASAQVDRTRKKGRRISVGDLEVVERLENEQTRRRGRGRLETLESTGQQLKVSISVYCFSDDRCVKKNPISEKGNFVQCDTCEWWYHKACLVQQKAINPSLSDAVLKKTKWQCPDCIE